MTSGFVIARRSTTSCGALRRIQLGQASEAVTYLEQARAIFPQGPDAWYLLGILSENEGENRRCH